MNTLNTKQRKWMNRFSFKFKMNGKRISKKSIVEKYGKDYIENAMFEAACDFVDLLEDCGHIEDANREFKFVTMKGVQVIPTLKY